MECVDPIFSPFPRSEWKSFDARAHFSQCVGWCFVCFAARVRGMINRRLVINESLCSTLSTLKLCIIRSSSSLQELMISFSYLTVVRGKKEEKCAMIRMLNCLWRPLMVLGLSEIHGLARK